jgi:sugar O-acyltransferase (sialic acid O-acetyltransferase NeuD family)
MKKIVIIGINTTAELLCIAAKETGDYEIVGFAVNGAYYKDSMFIGYPVYKIEELEEIIDKKEVEIFVAIQWNKLNKDRARVYLELKNKGFNFATVISKTALVKEGSVIGENCWIADYVVIDPYTVIGNNVIIRSKVWVGCYGKISDHCYISNSAMIAGKMNIGENSFLGIGSIIYGNIGRKCIVGMGAIVRGDLSDFALIKTQRDSVIQYDEETIESKLITGK